MGEFQVNFNDVINVRYILLISIGVAVVASFIYLILLRYFSGIITWVFILAFVALFGLLGYLFWTNNTVL